MRRAASKKMVQRTQGKPFPDDSTFPYTQFGIDDPYLSQISTKRTECILATDGIGMAHFRMEDNRSIYHRDNISIYSIYDGHGGESTSHKAASELSHILYNTLSSLNLKSIDDSLIKKLIKQVFIDYDIKLFSSNQHIYVGTTVTIVIHLKSINTLYFVNLGDSRTIFIKPQGKNTNSYEVILETTDHTAKSTPEIQRIVKAGGFVNNGKLNGSLGPSRALGDFEFKINTDGTYNSSNPILSPIPDVFSANYESGILVLASDGLWDVVTSSNVVNIVEQNINNISNIRTDLITKAIQEKSHDNITVMVIFI